QRVDQPWVTRVRRAVALASGLLAAAVLVPVTGAGAGAAPGFLDPGFGVDGVAAPALAVPSHAMAVALQPDGRMVVAGWRASPTGAGTAVVARMLADGRIDSGFATGGVFTATVQGTLFTAVAVQPDGRIVLSGDTTDDRTPRL